VSARDDGGPAYPAKLPNQCTDGDEARDFAFWQGMSLRDAFAIAAMQGIMAASAHAKTPPGVDPCQHIATMAFMVADAMLAERAK
jgi:hypothetical protein